MSEAKAGGAVSTYTIIGTVDANGKAQAVSGSTPFPVVSALGTDSVYSGSTALTPKFAKANIAASQTATSLVAAVTGKKIRVVALAVVAGANATDITFNSASTAKSCLFSNGANGGEVLPFSPVGWFETVAGEALTVTTSSGSTTGIQVVYIEV